MSYDITKCGGGACPLQMNCYRFTSETLGRQDFFGSTPFDFQANQCEHFWDNTAQIQALAYLIWEKESKPIGQEVAHWEQAKAALKAHLSA